MKRKIRLGAVLIVIAAAAAVYFWLQRPGAMTLTGVVTTDETRVNSEIQGRLENVLVKEGDAVRRGQLLAAIQPQEWKAEMEFYARGEQRLAALVRQSEADLRYQEVQTSNQIRQAEANLAAAQAQVEQGKADLENARKTLSRMRELFGKGVESAQTRDQAQTAFDGAAARLGVEEEQARAARVAVDLAKANAEQIAARRAMVEASEHERAAAGAQKEKARVQLGYTEIRAPMDGVVNVRAALSGEVVSPGQTVVTLVNPDDYWVRADVEESRIDHIRLGDKFTVRFASGQQRLGTVFYRGMDAGYATQRDVSRTKRDIKTFEIRLRCDNRDRALALGMTAYVLLPRDVAD